MNIYTHGGDVYRHPDALDFSANLNPLGMPETVRAAAQKGVEKGIHYPDALCEKLRESLAEYEKVPQEWLIFGNGAAELIFALAHALRPRKALIPAPTFGEYEQALRAVDCEIAYELLQREEQFQIQERILDQLTEDIDLVFLCNPNNPTGLLIREELLERILLRCEEKQIWLAVDECFLDFVPDPGRHTLKDRLKDCGHLLVLKAFTKRYAMPGLRLGYGISANLWLLRQMERQLQPWNVSIPAQEAGIAALGEQAYVERARRLIQTERSYLKKELGRLGYSASDSQANYLFFQGESSLYAELLKKGILIRDCRNYVGLSAGDYRIAVRTHEENRRLIEAMERRE